MINDFTFSRIPHVIFGSNKIKELKKLIKNYGRNTLLLTGKNSFKNSDKYHPLITNLKKNKISVFEEIVNGEPTSGFIDRLVQEFFEEKIDVVVAIGGGSVIDAGKAISAMMGKKDSVTRFLEGVGDKTHNGSKIPFIAVPTTAGTGSEATKNAVLRKVGKNGFKKSLRHDNFIPDAVIIDPQLHLNCPPKITAACGMDAFTQLLESYVSTNASPMTDALALNGLRYINESLFKAYTHGATNIKARAGMAYASFFSGITLANAGLGTVHGFASVIGGYYNIPHGAVCGILMGVVVRKNIATLLHAESKKSAALKKYAIVGRMFSGDSRLSDITACESLIEIIDELTEELHLPALRTFGIKKSHFEKIASETSNKYNPVEFNVDELLNILEKVY